MNIGQYIYSKLSATTAVTDLVGTRIYPIYLPQNAAYPAIVFTAQNEPPFDSKTQASDHDRETVTFHIWDDGAQGADAYAKLDAIDAAIRTALEYVEGTAGGVTVVSARRGPGTDGRNEEMTLFMRERVYTFITKN